MRTTFATTVFKMPLFGVCLSLSALQKSLEQASSFAKAMEDKSKHLFLNKGLLLTDRNHYGHKAHKFYNSSNNQNAESFYLEEPHQSVFKAAKSSHESSRLFYLLHAEVFCLAL